MLFFLERKPEKFISENNMVKVQMVEPLCDAFSTFCLCFGSFANQLRQELLALNSITVERKIFFWTELRISKLYLPLRCVLDYV